MARLGQILPSRRPTDLTHTIDPMKCLLFGFSSFNKMFSTSLHKMVALLSIKWFPFSLQNGFPSLHKMVSLLYTKWFPFSL